MIKTFTYFPKGVCSRRMEFTYDDESMTLVTFDVVGGCSGNLKGIKSLIEGQSIQTIIEKLSGICCGFKNTSCPDQIATALKTLL